MPQSRITLRGLFLQVRDMKLQHSEYFQIWHSMPSRLKVLHALVCLYSMFPALPDIILSILIGFYSQPLEPTKTNSLNHI